MAEFATIPDLVRAHARERPSVMAMADDAARVDWCSLDHLVDRIAAGLQRDGATIGDVVATLALNSIAHVAVLLAIVRIGAVAAPLSTTASPGGLAALLDDCRPTHLFTGVAACSPPAGVICVALVPGGAGLALAKWLAPQGSTPAPVPIAPDDAFNIIYSSGTTGAPKGIVQSHAMRWAHVQRGHGLGYDAASITLNSTPLYSNTTLVSLLPTLAAGGAVVLMAKFDARGFLERAEAECVTHAALVPVQIARILAVSDFDRFDLSAFRLKTSTGAPFAADVKREALRRWPGELVEIYGLTEGGASAVLRANKHPDKLHTVGQPSPGNEMRLIDPHGREVAPGEAGEIVGRGPAMMSGYRNRPEESAAAEWLDEAGGRFIRQGDIGRFDEDGFLVLLGRAKDVIISGGFNIYPSDLEAALRAQPGVIDVAVVGASDRDWGETPVAFAVLVGGTDAELVRTAANAALGRTQRIRAIHVVDELPRSAIGKVLKRELQARANAGSADADVAAHRLGERLTIAEGRT